MAQLQVMVLRRVCCRRSWSNWLLQLLLIVTVFTVTYIITSRKDTRLRQANTDLSPELSRKSLETSNVTLNESKHQNDSKITYIHKNSVVNPGINGSRLKEVFVSGKWNSSLVSQYHAHYDVNCAAIVRGERQAIDAANSVLRRIPPKIPSDETVKKWTDNCDHYRNARHFPTRPRSQEEAEFPIAYIITTHTDSSQFERLFRMVFEPQNVYCIHPDAKSPSTFQEAIRSIAACFENVFIVSTPVKVNYAHSSRLQADVNCMSDLLERQESWKYVVNLCGQDFPLKTNLEIVRQLKAYKGHNDIPGITAPDWFDHRTRVHHEFRNNMMVKLPDVKKPPPPQNFTFFWGNAYYAATKEYAHYVVHNQTAIELLKYSEDTYSPDEHYWVTLHRIPGVPGGHPVSSWDSVVRMVHWKGTSNSPECVGRYVRNICIFGAGYVRHLATFRHLFANKFHMSFDPIAMQCMEELLDYRSMCPESIADFVPEFPTRHMFGM